MPRATVGAVRVQRLPSPHARAAARQALTRSRSRPRREKHASSCSRSADRSRTRRNPKPGRSRDSSRLNGRRSAFPVIAWSKGKQSRAMARPRRHRPTSRVGRDRPGDDLDPTSRRQRWRHHQGPRHQGKPKRRGTAKRSPQEGERRLPGTRGAQRHDRRCQQQSEARAVGEICDRQLDDERQGGKTPSNERRAAAAPSSRASTMTSSTFTAAIEHDHRPRRPEQGTCATEDGYIEPACT